MQSVFVILAVASAVAAAPSRSVRWYVDAGRVDANVAFVAAHGDALSGLYLCCNSFAFAADGTFGGISAATVREQTAPLYAARANLSLYYVVGVDDAAIHSGSWAAHVGAAAAAAADFQGFIVDYEPDTN